MNANRLIRVLRVLPVVGTGGSELQCVEVLEELQAHRSRYGIEAELIAIYAPRTEVFRTPQGVRFSCLRHPRTMLGILKAARDLRPLMRSFDCVHALLWPAIWAVALAGGKRPPLVASFHGSKIVSGILQLKRPFDRWFFARAARLVAISGAGQLALASYLGVDQRDIAVIGNGKRPYTGPWPERQGVVCLARAFAPKRQDLLLDALALLPRDTRPATTFIGLGTDAARFSAAVRDRGLDNVQLMGQVLDPLQHLAAAQVLALPTEHEGLPNAVLEAWGTTTPVIASNVSGVRELVRDGEDGVLVANTPRDWADQLTRLLADNQLRERLAQAGHQRMAQAFSLQETAMSWAQLYREVVALREAGSTDV